ACQNGSIRRRAMWIAGAAGLVWTHYIFLPFLVAFPVAYLAGSSLRARYPPRAFAVDAAIIVALLLPAAPQFAQMAVNRQAQAWMFSPKHLGVFGQLLPFALALVFPVRDTEHKESTRQLRRLLWLAIAAQLVALEGAAFVGIDVVSTRYASVTIVAAAI